MINLRSDQKCFKTCTSFLFEAGQQVHNINHSLKNTKLKYDSSLNHLTSPIITKMKTYSSFGSPPCHSQNF